MVKEIFSATPLISPDHKAPIPIARLARMVRLRSFSILSTIGQWLLGNFWLWVRRKYTPAMKGQRLRELLENLGFMWIKLGQLLAIREDLFSPETCQELGKLHYQAIGFPWEEAREIIEQELKAPLDRFFDIIEPTPFAAASICQVHKARLRFEQQWVAVKVQRPNIQSVFNHDISFLRALFQLLQQFNIMSYARWDELIWELNQILQEETDYRYEEANLRGMRKALRSYRKVHSPRVYSRYCAKQVLVMEFIDGVVMSDYLLAAKKDPNRLSAWLDENNIDPEEVGLRLFETFYRQLTEDNYFHADLHPGNIMLLRDSRLVLIDLGTVGTLEKELNRKYHLMLEAIAQGEFAKAADYSLLLCPELPMIDMVRVRESMIRCFRSWEARTALRNMSYHDKSFGNMGQELSKIMTDNKIAGSWAFLKMLRAWTTMDASLYYLLPNADYTKLFRRCLRNAQRRQLRSQSFWKRWGASLSSLQGRLDEFNLMLGPILRRQAHQYEGVTSKLARVGSMLFRGISWLFFLTILVIIGDMIQHHYPHLGPDRFPWLKHSWINELLSWIPGEEWTLAILLMVLNFLLFRFFRRMAATLRQKEFGVVYRRGH